MFSGEYSVLSPINISSNKNINKNNPEFGANLILLAS